VSCAAALVSPQNSEVLGPPGAGKAAKTVLGSGLKNDPVVAVLSQQNKGWVHAWLSTQYFSAHCWANSARTLLTLMTVHYACDMMLLLSQGQQGGV
jgi:hypothetical protein